MKILIIRHAEPDYSIDSLTEKGWREAELLSDRLASIPDADFYCSPLGRARDTASLTMKKLKREAVILPWLTEFSGQIVNPNDATYRIPWNLAPTYWTRCPELFDKDRWLENDLMRTGNVRQVYADTCSGVQSLLVEYGFSRDGQIWRCARNTTDTVVLFCHFAIGQAIVGYLLGIAPSLLWHGTVLPPSSVTTLISEERISGSVFFRCMQMGDTSHLYCAGEPVSHAGLFPECFDAEHIDEG